MKTSEHNKDTATYIEYLPMTVQLQPVLMMTDDQFYEFCQINRDLRIERSPKGELIVMPPTGGETGQQNSEINMQLRLWAKQDGTGAAFDSSSGFTLPNGAVRSPDAAWIKKSRLATLTAEQKKKFIPLCPDFVVELRSPNDSLSILQNKMHEYIENGAELGWLIDPMHKRVFIYRPQSPVEELKEPETISGNSVLSGFTLDLREVWQ